MPYVDHARAGVAVGKTVEDHGKPRVRREMQSLVDERRGEHHGMICERLEYGGREVNVFGGMTGTAHTTIEVGLVSKYWTRAPVRCHRFSYDEAERRKR